MLKFITSLFENKTIKVWHLILLNILIFLVTFYIEQFYLYTQEFYYILYRNIKEIYQIDMQYITHKQNMISSCIIGVLIVLLKVFVISLLIQFISLIFKAEIKLKLAIKVSSIAYYVVLLGQLVKILWYISLPSNIISLKYISIIPLSLTNLFSVNKLSQQSILILNNFNLFELLYAFILWQLMLNIVSKKNALKIVLIIIMLQSMISIIINLYVLKLYNY